MKVSGNTILITGGSSGIGFELCKQLSGQDNTIIITGRDKAKLDRAKKELPQLVTIASDVAKSDDIIALYNQVQQQFPKLNLLINNAGVMRTINFHEDKTTLDELTFEIEVNLKGTIRMVKQFLPLLKRQTNAAIVNVSSGLAFVPLPISPIYCATKAALHSFTQSLRVQLKNTAVKVFEVAPPATQTELLGDFDANDMKGITIMKVDDMVRQTLRGIADDRFEIRPGQSNQLKFMSRVAPDFILAQMSKTVDRMLATPG